MLDELPGIARRSAEKILAETGTEMKQFRDADHFASWAGLVPQCNESAGKKKGTRLRKGNKYLKETLVECARVAIRKKGSFFYAKYCKIAARRGGKRALIAVAHRMLVIIYHILKNKNHFFDLGSDYFVKLDEERIKNRNINILKKMGYEVSLTPLKKL